MLMHSSDSIFPSFIRSFRGERTTVAGPYSCHLEHLASHNLLGRMEHRMSATIQSLTGLQQNPFLMPRLCSANHHAGRLTGDNVIMGGNVKRTQLSNFADRTALFTVIYGVSIHSHSLSVSHSNTVYVSLRPNKHKYTRTYAKAI